MQRAHVVSRRCWAMLECDATHSKLSTISMTSCSRKECHFYQPLSTFRHISRVHFDTEKWSRSSLYCNTTAGNFGSRSSNCHLWYEHSVVSAELFTCEMSIAVIVIKAKTAPNNRALAEIPKSDSECKKYKMTSQQLDVLDGSSCLHKYHFVQTISQALKKYKNVPQFHSMYLL